MNSVLICPHCKAKLKVKPASLKFIKEIKCIKCGKTFPVSPEMKSSSVSSSSTSSASIQEAPIHAVNKEPERNEPVTDPRQSEEISFVCPKCGRNLKIQKSMAGQQVKCKEMRNNNHGSARQAKCSARQAKCYRYRTFKKKY